MEQVQHCAVVQSLGSRLRRLLHRHVHVLVAVHQSRAIGDAPQIERRFTSGGRQIISTTETLI